MKTLVVLSGGMDSATALAMAVAMSGRSEVDTITFNYGSKHNDRENLAAIELAKHYGVSSIIVAMPFVNDLFKSDLLKSGGDVPEGHYADPSMKRTVVPFRNGIMLAVAAGYAESIGSAVVMLGNHAGDHAIYPDCRKEFTDPMSAAIASGTYAGVKLFRPFEMVSKTDIARFGSSLGVPYVLTYSCYNGREKHCGKCGTCFERREAFRDAGVSDPTEYEST